MSARLLRQLQAAHAFNPTPPEADLGHLHVPFDSLTGRLRYEQVLAEALQRGERVALIGPSGSGKSSVTEHVLGSFVHDLAPIRVRVGLEPDAVASDPGEFARHLVRTVAKYLRAQKRGPSVARQAEQARRSTGAGVRRPVKITLGGGTAWMRGDLAVELQGAVETVAPSGQDVLDQAQRVLEIIAAWDLRPVLVLDDTDHWLSRPGLPEPHPLIAGFFGRVIRLIAEGLPAAAVIAVHETYLRNPNYLDAVEFLETQVTLPAVPDGAAIGRILAHRAERTLGATRLSSEDFIDAAALDRLYADYDARSRSLRAQVQTAHGALTYSCDAGADVIGPAHIELALTD